MNMKPRNQVKAIKAKEKCWCDAPAKWKIPLDTDTHNPTIRYSCGTHARGLNDKIIREKYET